MLLYEPLGYTSMLLYEPLGYTTLCYYMNRDADLSLFWPPFCFPVAAFT